MPRQVRIEYEGATYHVMCRGDRRESIFADEADREMFLATLADRPPHSPTPIPVLTVPGAPGAKANS